jgi:hypothetical protein
MNALIACEYSGIVRDAFTKEGHNAISCDYLPSDTYGQHYTGDVMDILNNNEWDIVIAFPPCTYICRAQVHLLKDPERMKKHLEAVEFVKKIWAVKCDKVVLENPIGLLSTSWMPPSQIISPNQFGDPYKKDICLWIRGLPLLQSTNIVEGRKKVSNHVNGRMTNEQRSKIKSKFFPGVAKAMAEQWGRPTPKLNINVSRSVLSSVPGPVR